MTVGDIALLDNTTNISYVTAKLLRAERIAADFIQEPGIPFNQQPIWEDMDLVEATDRGNPPRHPGYQDGLEAELGWQRPAWVVRPGFGAATIARFPVPVWRAMRRVPRPLAPFAAVIPVRHLLTIVEAARRRFVVALGPAAVEAHLTGRPFAVVVTGWDVRELPFLTHSRNPVLRARAWLQRAALAEARAILVQPASDLPHLERLGLAHRARPFNIPVDLQRYGTVTSRAPAEVFGAEIAARAEGKLVIFAPARVHFAVKRNDILLDAFAVVARETSAHLIMLDWGPDAERARAMIGRLGIHAHVSFLPFVMSKLRLVRALLLADVVADQFLYTAYGSLTREALACGRPLVSSYDAAAPQPHAPDDPAPIISARTPHAVADACLALVDSTRRTRIGRDAKEWSARQNAASLAALRSVLDGAA